MKVSPNISSTNSNEPTFFSVPLTKIAHGYAQKFYRAHGGTHKGKQVYLNTLAIYAVNYYLKCLDVKTNLEASDSWNPIIQSLANVADLLLPNRGKLECCPVWSEAEVYHISPDAAIDRIGYVAVWLDNNLTEATLLGFSVKPATNEILINELEPLENLVPYLDKLAPELQTVKHKGLLEKLRSLLDSGWQQVEPLWTAPANTPQLAFGYRSGESPIAIGYLATETLNFSQDLLPEPIKLNLAVMPQSKSRKIDFIAELSGECLPSNLKLLAQETSGEIIISETAQEGDTSICLQFARELEKSFNLVVRWGEFDYIKTWESDIREGELQHEIWTNQ